MTRKLFFKERTLAEIKALNLKQVYSAGNLVRRILDLSNEDSLELRFPLIPGRFRAHTRNSTEASRKCYKHGDLITLSQPKTQGGAYESREIPLQVRKRDFDKLRTFKEEEINFLGYSFYPVQGRDTRKRVVPFAWLPEARRLFAYAENLAGGIEVRVYDDAERVDREGAEAVCKIPSRTKKKGRYRVKLSHVPVFINTEGNAIAYSLKSDFEISPEIRTYADIRYTWRDDRESIDRFVFYPQDIAAYMAVINNYAKQHKLGPITFSPIALISRKEAEFYKKLCNNVVIYDLSLQGRNKTRKLHVPEKSILIARSIKVLGHDETMFSDAIRDGKLRDYDW